MLASKTTLTSHKYLIGETVARRQGAERHGRVVLPGSGPVGAVAQICWLGHPAHDSAFPAASDSVPGQSAAAKTQKPIRIES
jgi:hypothetical protein